MAGTGSAPQSTHQRERDTKRRVSAEHEVTADGQVRGPDLPGAIEWPVVTLAWWETWRRSPQAQTFTDTDWDFMVDTALLHARFWRGDASIAGELRLRVAKFGATVEDRRRLRMEIGDPVGAEEPKQTAEDPYAGLKIQD